MQSAGVTVKIEITHKYYAIPNIYEVHMMTMVIQFSLLCIYFEGYFCPLQQQKLGPQKDLKVVQLL